MNYVNKLLVSLALVLGGVPFLPRAEGSASLAPPGKDTLEFTVKSTQSVGSKYEGDPFKITLSFTCCEQAADCVPIEISLQVNKGDKPEDIANRLAGLLEDAFSDGGCNVTVQATGGRSVQVYGLPHEANPNATPDSPGKAPPDAKENQTEPYVTYAGYAFTD